MILPALAQTPTLDSFLAVLKKGVSEGTIRLVNAPIIALRFYRPDQPASYSNNYCPLTAVCILVGGPHHNSGSWDLAARELGMPKFLASDIVSAADGHYIGNDQLLALRNQLMETLNP